MSVAGSGAGVNLRRVVPALGVAQIISWGTLFYSIAVLGAPMREALHTSDVALFGGFASTVFWPLSQYLLDTIGWRYAFGVYAALHALVCLPLHVAFAPAAALRVDVAPVASAGDTRDAAEDAAVRHGPHVFAWLAFAFALATFASSALSAHLIGLLTFSGLTARDAVLIGSLIGPMQVAGRIMEFAFDRHLRALAVGTLAFALLAIALVLLSQVHGVWIVALAFAICYGWSNGVMTIVRGTVPAELFGHRGYGALLGRLAQPQFIAKAAAPLALTLVFAVDPTRVATLAVLVAIGALALYAYRRAIRRPPAS